MYKSDSVFNRDKISIKIPRFERFLSVKNHRGAFPTEQQNICVLLQNEKYLYRQTIELPVSKLPPIQKICIKSSNAMTCTNLNIFEIVKLQIEESFLDSLSDEQEKGFADALQKLTLASPDNEPITSSDFVMLRHIFSQGILRVSNTQEAELEISQQIDYFRQFIFRLQNSDSDQKKPLTYDCLLSLTPYKTGKPYFFELPVKEQIKNLEFSKEGFAEHYKGDHERNLFPNFAQRQFAKISEEVAKKNIEHVSSLKSTSSLTKAKNLNISCDICLVKACEVDFEITKIASTLQQGLITLSKEIQNIGQNNEKSSEWVNSQKIPESKIDYKFFEDDVF
jgi:hypothetical protein